MILWLACHLSHPRLIEKDGQSWSPLVAASFSSLESTSFPVKAPFPKDPIQKGLFRNGTCHKLGGNPVKAVLFSLRSLCALSVQPNQPGLTTAAELLNYTPPGAVFSTVATP